MVKANVDNTAISKQISSGNSVSVPSGEVWKISLLNWRNRNGSNDDHLYLNGDEFSYTWDGGSHRYEDVVLKAGDTFDAQSGTLFLHGFKVRE